MSQHSQNSEVIEGVVLDATVLSNYAATDSVGFLASTFSYPMATRAVREELEQGVDEGRLFLKRALQYLYLPFQPESNRWIAVYRVNTTGTVDEIRKLDYGERHTLAYARYHGYALATDDMEARKVADQFEIPYTGSLGILVRGIDRGEISLKKAEDWHSTWIADNNYYSPVDSVSEVL